MREFWHSEGNPLLVARDPPDFLRPAYVFASTLLRELEIDQIGTKWGQNGLKSKWEKIFQRVKKRLLKWSQKKEDWTEFG